MQEKLENIIGLPIPSLLLFKLPKFKVAICLPMCTVLNSLTSLVYLEVAAAHV